MRFGVVIGIMLVILGGTSLRRQSEPDVMAYVGTYEAVTESAAGMVRHRLTLRNDYSAELISSDETAVEVPALTGVWLTRGSLIDVSVGRAGQPLRSVTLNLVPQFAVLTVRAAFGDDRGLSGLTFVREREDAAPARP